MYFKNRRVRKDRDRVEVKAHLKKLVKVPLQDGKKFKKVANVWGMVNFAPTMPEGEDDTSIAVNTINISFC